ncbi:MAG TPA: transglutaminaseTgpA domain-containing protein [Ottowia sp.]|uniref:transglutaminase family protein n=1 Tax=Ottowia sp. TaxID=1898956 RepID=UPI002BC3DC64|nr:transglutaminaseTgpA domain-containing protein [Ottowia sp.]HMN21139.1 transglutaminaseTgpA domain-containing protein [Ottowia sp.]
MKAWIGRLQSLPREARDTLFVLLLVAWIVLPQVPYLPLWCSALVAIVLIFRGWLALGSRALPGRWWLAGLLVLAVFATRRSHGTLVGQEAGVTLVVSLLALKTLELRARRDALVVFFLGFFTMLTGFFESQSLLRAAAVLVGLLGLLTALINAHRPVGLPSLRESAGLALRMTLAGAPVMLALFLLFPRFAPLWGMPSDSATGRSGLSSSMAVGSVAELALDDGIALRVRFEGAPPPQAALYFRGPVLSRFDGRNWTAAGGGDGFDAALGPPPRDLRVAGAPIDYEVTLEPSRRPWLLTLDAAPQAPDLPPHWRARQSPDLQWLSARPVTELLRYRARSYTDFSYGQAGWDGQPRRDLGRFLELPAGYNPRTLELAETLRRQAPEGDAGTLIEAALQRLRDGGYRYTLEPGVYGRDSADEFWFDRKAGFCEHIASAFVVLLRGAGVPARIVTGFQGGELNGVDGYWTVRNADAHAWTEAWLAGRGWVRVDPTGAVMPGRVGQAQRLRAAPGLVASALGAWSPNLLTRLRATWEAIDNGWNQWVLSYTQDRQFGLLRWLGVAEPNWQDLGRVLAGLLALGALGAAAWAAWERSEHDPWLRLLERARRRLRRLGLAVPAQAAPRQLAQLVSDPAQAGRLPPALRSALADWLIALERQRYDPAASRNGPTLATLGRVFRHLPWPRPS